MLISKRRKAKKARLRHAEYYDLTATFDDLYERSRNRPVSYTHLTLPTKVVV